jgi:2'-5' RNA ligase
MLHRQALERIRSGGFEYDPFIDDPTDIRRGLTLLFRLETPVLLGIQEFLKKVQRIAPDQFFYSNVDIHITVMPIISCYAGFTLNKVNPEEYIQLIESCLNNIPHFDVEFRGVFFSPSCIIVKGYPLNGTLEQIRQNLRREFAKAPLEQSLDRRYILRTAHSTVVRFREPVQQSHKMEELVLANEDLNFGISTVKKLTFVCNDWYQRNERVQVLKDFLLK